MRPDLLAFYSPCPGCGKTTLANLLEPYEFETYSFADPLREMIAVLLRAIGYDAHKIMRCFFFDLKEVPIPELGGKTPRYLLQTIGTEWGRELVTPEIWTNIMATRLRNRTGPVVIDDLRFPNEYVMLRGHGAILVRIDRPGFERSGDHVSDGVLNSFRFDFQITNDAAPEDMLRRLKRGVRKDEQGAGNVEG